MKALAYLGFVLLLLGCRLFDFPRPVLLRLQNDSNFDVKITPFQKGKLISPGTLLIGKGKYLEKVEPPNEANNPYFSIGTDSIVIIFDAKKILIQSCKKEYLGDCLDIINNLNINKAEESLKTGKYNKRYTFKITKDDYDRAVDIVK